MSDTLSPHGGIIAWFARNPVAANLLMIAIIIAGLQAAFTARKQMFPQMENTWINVSVAYRGAAPQEVEEAITVKLEEALASVQGLERIITRSRRGAASADLKVLESYDPKEVLDDINSAIDGIASFPDGMETPQVSHTQFRQEVMYISLAGDVSARDLKNLGEQIHDEIRALPGINITEFYSGANYEIAIEIDPDKLYQYNLDFLAVAAAVRNFSTNQSAGEVRTDGGLISVRVNDQAYIGAEFERIPVRTFANGTQLYLQDIATINDGFEEGIHHTKLDGLNTVTFFVGASSDQSVTDIATTVHQYIADRQDSLPQGVRLEPWVDLTYYLKGRLNMMLSNMFYGGILVFCILALFLRMRLAFWVMMGLPISFLGAMSFLPLSWVDVTINIASLFAFIMVLGVVVDDAIIIGESVHTETEKNGQTLENVIIGARRVATPATFGVLTTMAAFVPMVLEDGPEAAFPQSIGFVVVLCLLFSLVESKLILPAHLARMKPENPNSKNWLTAARKKIDGWQKRFIKNQYTPFLSLALRYRYTVLAIFTGLIIVTAALFQSGNIRFINFPKIPHDFVRIEIEMSSDASEQATLDAILAIDTMIANTDANIAHELGGPMVAKVLVDVNGRTSANVQAKLVDPDQRPMSPFELTARWRKTMPEIVGLDQITIVDNLFGGDRNDGDLSFRLKSRDDTQLRGAADAIKVAMNDFKGVSEVNDSERDKTPEVQFNLKPLATSLGLTTAEVAAQMSYSLYGIEAQRIVRDRQEIRVVVRYPEAQRQSLDAINNVLITTASGAKVPLEQLANISLDSSFEVIYRENGNRAITVWGSVDTDTTEPFKVADSLRNDIFPGIFALYPKVTIEESGTLKDQREDTASQMLNILLILIPIYVLLALPLRSYSQPLMIMSIIPFGVIGAIAGHLILGLNVSQMSIFGIFAVVGVVVNDSLVMVDFINTAIKQNIPLHNAVVMAGQRRFRAIVLTSLTTFIGLMPIINETSLQAKIVIPMAVSLAFGVLFATVVTLILVPCLYVLQSDIKAGFRNLGGWVKHS